MAPPTSALRDYGLASQARETDGAPSLPLEKGRVSRSTIYRTLWRFHSLEPATLTAPAAGVARSNAYHSPVSQIAQIKTARCSLMFKKKQKKSFDKNQQSDNPWHDKC